jgi:hypothetical protein
VLEKRQQGRHPTPTFIHTTFAYDKLNRRTATTEAAD